MLTQITLKHFKCFETLQLPLAPLTLLSGTNATGKSTTLQALSLLHQTIHTNEWSNTIILNGENVHLGTASDVIDKISGRREFIIGLDMEQAQCRWHIKAEDRFALSVPIDQITWQEAPDWKPRIFDSSNSPLRSTLPPEILESSAHARKLAITLNKLTYISAERFGPRETYTISSPDQYSNVGPHGERTPWFLDNFANRHPVAGLVREDAPPTLQRQAESWLRHFFPGSSFVIHPVRDANLVTMGIRTSNATDFHRPQNVGFGLTHVLPIITACMGAALDDLIMIENPESHLHPSGQAEMGEFLAKCAASGLQIFLETHSDHVLNGIRRAVKKQVILPKNVAIHFFTPRQDDDALASQVISPLIDTEGNLNEWPENFFDQIDKDSDFLLGWV